MSTERRSLEAEFAPTSARGTKLEGLLPKRKTARPPQRQYDSSPEPGGGGTTLPTAATPTVENKKTPSGSHKASEAVPGAPRNVGVYIEPEQLSRLKGRARVQQLTYSDLLVEAFDQVDDETLAKQFEPEQVSAGAGMPRRVRRPRGTAGIQIQLRLDDRQIEWLQQKAQTVGAPSRSACVSTVFQLYMDHLQD